MAGAITQWIFLLSQLQVHCHRQAAAQFHSSHSSFEVALRKFSLNEINTLAQVSDLKLAAAVGVDSRKNALVGSECDSSVAFERESGRKRDAPTNDCVVGVSDPLSAFHFRLS